MNMTRMRPIDPVRTIGLLPLLGSLLGAGLLLPALGGCDDQLRRDQEAAVLALERGEDRLALEDARRLSGRGSSLQRAEAGYIGGLAAFRLGEYREAIRLLDLATTSSDAELRGMALIQRGTVELALGQTRRAARSLEAGGTSLGGELGARALLRASESYQTARLEADARRCREAARRLDGGTAIDPSLAGYTLQFGAYTKRGNAEARANDVSSQLRRAGIPAPVLKFDDGFYKVQAGSYPDKAAAGRALGRLRLPAVGGVRIAGIGD